MNVQSDNKATLHAVQAMSKPLWTPHAGRLICVLSSSALLLAATLKWAQLPVADLGPKSVSHLPVLLIVVIALEAAMAQWLLFGRWPRWSRWIPGACFAIFAVVALHQALTGVESCGCFGRVKVNPWITFGMDVLLTAGLLMWPPGREPVIRLPRLGLMPRVGIVGAAVAVALGLSLWRLPRPVVAGTDGEPAGLLQAGSLTILEPSRWIGRALPLISEIDIGEQLRTGKWVAVLHQAHCSTCREALPFYEAQARAAGETKAYGVALIEMPPHEGAHSHDSHAVWGTLSAGREWFASTPAVLLLDNGIVRDAAEGKPAVALTPDWEAMKLIPAGTDAREAAVVR